MTPAYRPEHRCRRIARAPRCRRFPLLPCEEVTEECLFLRVQEVERRLEGWFGQFPAMRAGDEVLRRGLLLLSTGQAKRMTGEERAALLWRIAFLTARRAAARERGLIQMDIIGYRLCSCQDDEEADLVIRLRAAIDRLPDPQREATSLRLLDGFSFKKAARVLGVSIGAARYRFSAGCGTLRDVLRDSLPPEFFREKLR